VPSGAHGSSGQVRRAVGLLALSQPVAVEVDVELPELGALEVGEVQQHHEAVRRPGRPPWVIQRRAVAGRGGGRLENRQGHGGAGIWLDGLRRRHVGPLWVGAACPPKTVVLVAGIPAQFVKPTKQKG